VTRGRLQAIHVVRRTPATRRVPGRRKASRLPRRRSPSRGTSRRGSRSAGMRKGLQPSENIPTDDQGVLDPPRRRGTSDALSLTARRREGPGTFAPGGSAHARTSTLPRPSSARPTVGSRRRLARGVSRSSVLRRPTSRRLAAAGRRRRRCGVARCLSSLGRGRAVARRAPREGRTGSGGQRTGTGGNTRNTKPARARIGRSRSCSRVVVVVAEVVRRCSAQRIGRFSISPDLEAVRGRAPSTGYQVRKHPGRGRRDTGTHGQAETSRDRFQAVGATRAGRGRLAMEGTPDRTVGISFTDAHSARSWQARFRSTRDERGVRAGQRQGCQRSGGIGSARKKKRRAPTRATRRSGSGVVKRQVTQSPSSWPASQGGGARRKPRRDAGNAGGASARSR